MSIATNKKIAIMKSYQNRQPIEVSKDGGLTWSLVLTEPDWDWSKNLYRRAPFVHESLDITTYTALHTYCNSTNVRDIMNKHGLSILVDKTYASVDIYRNFDDINYNIDLFIITKHSVKICEDVEFIADHKLFEILTNIIKKIRGIDEL